MPLNEKPSCVQIVRLKFSVLLDFCVIFTSVRDRITISEYHVDSRMKLRNTNFQLGGCYYSEIMIENQKCYCDRSIVSHTRVCIRTNKGGGEWNSCFDPVGQTERNALAFVRLTVITSRRGIATQKHPMTFLIVE